MMGDFNRHVPKMSVDLRPSRAVTSDDATWILTATFIIFTMQTGFALLESGCVTKKNEVNILVKNLADVVLGGLTYWAFGYGLQYGTGPWTNPFFAVGSFFLDSDDEDTMGITFATFIFQLSFATTATTIVSGAMAERTNLTAYCLYSFFNPLFYSIPAGWAWGSHGFLKRLGFVDYAGGSSVHLLGGSAALVATLMLRPRLRRFDSGAEEAPSMGNPTNFITGAFMLWWGAVGFTCGSTFGISYDKWHYAGRAAISTVSTSVAGGLTGVAWSYYWHRKFIPSVMVNALLGSIVSITSGCALYQPWEALIVGCVGASIVTLGIVFFEKLRVDDPVGAISIHGGGGMWSTLAVGLFVRSDTQLRVSAFSGLLKGGGFYLLGVQMLGTVLFTAWSLVSTFFLLRAINWWVPIRLRVPEEMLGADLVEHNVRHFGYDYDRVLKGLQRMGCKLNHKPWITSVHPEIVRQRAVHDQVNRLRRHSINQTIQRLNHQEAGSQNPSRPESQMTTIDEPGAGSSTCSRSSSTVAQVTNFSRLAGNATATQKRSHPEDITSVSLRNGKRFKNKIADGRF